MREAKADAKGIFLGALECAGPEALASYLDQACGPDAVLRHRIEELLQAHRDAGGFLGGCHNGDSTRDSAAERPGTVIGPYKLLEPTGEGGMGTVWMAQQTEPVKRVVALKLIKAGMDSKQVIARFEAERQALALMDHVNIARVLDAGTTSSGRPYFVMDLVKGVPITKYCDEHHLTPRQRLELFIPVCQAVQHAHQKGIIHRDLKPSNVLVAVYDGKPVPKVIDFGVAKATGQSLTEKTLVTGFGAIVGTLEYMSPEQAEINQLDVDTRSDIYALGVLLYELLTSTTPLERERIEESGMLEALRIIREEEAPTLSNRLSTVEELPKIAANRGLEPAKLTRTVRGELDWIVMKALEKDRSRRYETASTLARDIERYLHGEVVQACPQSVNYRLRKWARQHRASLLAAIAVLAVLVTISLGATASAFREHRLKQEAEAKADALDHSLYYHRVALAEQRLAANQLAPVEELLRGCPPRLRNWEWYYLRRWSYLEPCTDLPGTDTLNIALAIARDGKYIAVGGTDGVRGTLRLWDAATLRKVRTFNGHQALVRAVAFAADGRLASGGDDGTVRVWDSVTGQQLQLYRVGRVVTSVAYSRDGKLLLTAGRDESGKCGEAQVRDVSTGKVVLTLEGQVRAVFSPDSRRIASSSPDGIVTVREAATGSVLFTCPGRASFIANHPWLVVFSADSRLLATVQMDTTVSIWNLETGELAHSLSGHSAPTWCLVFSPDGSRFASAGMDRTVKLWDLSTDQEVLTLHGHTAAIEGLAFSPDGRRLVSAAQDGCVKVWDATPVDGPVGPLLGTFSGHSGLVGQAAFHPEGDRVASASVDGSVSVWDARTTRIVHNLPNGAEDALSVTFSPDGRHLASAGRGNRVTVWDATTGQQWFQYCGHSSFILRVAYRPDGTCVASLDGRGELHLWEASTGKELTILQCPGQGLGLTWSPDGRLLAAGNALGRLKVWNAQTYEEILHVQPGLEHRVYGLAFSGDARSLAMCGGSSPTISLIDATTGQLLRAFVAHREGVYALASSPDGRFLVSGGMDGLIKIWDPLTGRELRTLRGHNGLISSLAYRPDGRLLVSGSWDTTVKVWDATVPPEVLYGPQARAALQARFAKLLLRADVMEDLHADAALGDEVRAVALQLAKDEDENPMQLNKAAIEAVTMRRQTSAVYRRALHWAKAACRLEPANGEFLNTLAAAQYRLGNYEHALATLVRAELLNGDRNEGPWPRNLALRAVLEIQMGRTEPARATLDQLREVLKSPRGSDAVDAKNWQREAEELILEKSTPASRNPAAKS
jgi:WD40 repeat protein/serine/threonine protein kinase